jgi:sigma-B regulation protein RsbU (phosphoserine phosphatase)
MRYHQARSVPCLGDVMDVFQCSSGRTQIAIGDVCGRDSQAQGHARYIRHGLRTLANQHSPRALLESMNVAFCRRVADCGDDRFASIFVAMLKGRRLTYASAGHEFALLMHATGRHRHLATTGAVIGVDAGQCYVENTLVIAGGDRLILVTDGITEARNARGAFFGTSGVVRAAVSAIRLAAEDPATRILEAARTHGRDGLTDDASVLCVRFS